MYSRRMMWLSCFLSVYGRRRARPLTRGLRRARSGHGPFLPTHSLRALRRAYAARWDEGRMAGGGGTHLNISYLGVELQLCLLSGRCESPGSPGRPVLVSFQWGVDGRRRVASPIVALSFGSRGIQEEQHCTDGIIVPWTGVQEAENAVVRNSSTGGLVDSRNGSGGPEGAGLGQPGQRARGGVRSCM